MKNKYKNKSHLSERRFRFVLQEFVLGTEASKAAIKAGLNRKTANKIYNQIRARIVLLAERERPVGMTNVQIDEAYFGASKATRSWYNSKTAVLGIISSKRVYTKILTRVSKSEIFAEIRATCKPGTTIFTDAAPMYKGLANEGFIHKAVNHSEYEFGRKEGGLNVTTNRIESYWAWTRLRLSRFKGIRYDKHYIHLKESEWRFNHRREDIYRLLLKMFRADPLF